MNRVYRISLSFFSALIFGFACSAVTGQVAGDGAIITPASPSFTVFKSAQMVGEYFLVPNPPLCVDFTGSITVTPLVLAGGYAVIEASPSHVHIKLFDVFNNPIDNAFEFDMTCKMWG